MIRIEAHPSSFPLFYHEEDTKRLLSSYKLLIDKYCFKEIKLQKYFVRNLSDTIHPYIERHISICGMIKRND